MHITDSVVETTVDPFEKIMQDFTQSPNFAELEIGELQSVQCRKQFERKNSSLRLYRVQGSGGSKNIYVKIAKNVYGKSLESFNSTIQQDFDTNRFWSDKLNGYSQFGSIRPVYLSMEFKAIITEETVGKNLGDLIRSQVRFNPSNEVIQTLVGHVHNAGKLLQAVQNEFKGERQYDLQELVEDIDVRMRALVANPAAQFSENVRETILDFYNKNMSEARQSEIQVGFMHRDFTMSNLLVDGEKVIVHDFSKIDIGPRLFDLTRFYHHLGLLKYKPIYSTRVVSELQQAFLDGYQYPEQTTDLLFRFFALRHYLSHYKGLLREKDRSLKSKLYDRWVVNRHIQNIYRIIKNQ
ncbi:MAG: phosphotransferase [Deferribacteres bacterium]|nr:phosphotransferase [Deferribacteres bacterium]